MQPYQTFYPQMNNGYGQQMPMQNPYQQRMDFLQSYQQNLQQPAQAQSNQMNVLGKIVDGIEVVKAMDIPADGNIYYFPKADGTEVYGKQWIINECKTRILTFKPISESDPNNSSQTEGKLKLGVSEDFTSTVLEKLDGLDNRINEILIQSLTKSSAKTMKSSTKKESVENE